MKEMMKMKKMKGTEQNNKQQTKYKHKRKQQKTTEIKNRNHFHDD